MMSMDRSSRIRFRKYRDRLQERKRNNREKKVVTWHSQERSAHRTRSFRLLFAVFLRMLWPYRKSMGVALGSLTFATMLALVPPAVTKFAVDQVFQGLPLPEKLLEFIPGARSIPETPRDQLLILVGIVAVVGLQLVGRWW